MKNFIFSRTRFLFFFFFIVSFQITFAISDLSTNDVQSFSLGNIRALSNGVINPAKISFSDEKEVGVSVLNHFQMSELNTSNLHLKYPNKWLNTGIGLASFGYTDYRIIQVQSAFSKKIHPDFALGINLNYLNETSIWLDNSQHYFSSDIGFFYTPSKQVHWALLIENVLANFDENKIAFSGGIKYIITENSSFYFESKYEKENPFSFSTGFEYEILDQFTIRSGFHSHPRTPSFGIAYKLGKWTIDAGFAFHSTLGISSMIGLSFILN